MEKVTRILRESDVAELLDMQQCIDVMDRTLREVWAGQTVNLQRDMIPQPAGNMFAIMGSSLTAQQRAGCKVIVFPGQQAKMAGSSQGIIPIFDTQTGRLLAIVDGEGVTGVRTAATSAAATRALAREDAQTLAILGAGRIGRLHVQAICAVRAIKKLYVWDIAEAATAGCCDWAQKEFGLETVRCQTAQQAVADADIICTVTQASEPVVRGEWLKPGAHINAVGACAPQVREVDTATIQRSSVFVDWAEAALRDTGDLVLPIREGAFTPDSLAGEIGAVLAGQLPGRRGRGEITLFESVGIAVEDLAAAQLVYERAQQQNRGALFTW